MSNIIFLLSSISVKMNGNEMENREEWRRVLIPAVMTSFVQAESWGGSGLEEREGGRMWSDK